MATVAVQVNRLQTELDRVHTILSDVRSQKDRLQYEVNAIHRKHGTYRIITHLRNEVQRLTISKLILIQTTALEMDRLRTIIRSLSRKRGERIDINMDDIHNRRNDYSRTQMLHDLLPAPTPTSPPSHFSWKDTFNLDIDEDDVHHSHGHLHRHHDGPLQPPPPPHSVSETVHDNDDDDDVAVHAKLLDTEDDIKIPEMNFDCEDGAIQPVSRLHRESSSEDDDDDDDEEDDSQNENDDEDDDDNSLESVGGESAGDQQIAIEEKRSMFADQVQLELAEQDSTSTHHDMREAQAAADDGDHKMLFPHAHDSSPQLQFAGDGDDYQIRGVATDAPILPPSTDYNMVGEEDHKLVISIQPMGAPKHEEEKLQLLELDLEDAGMGEEQLDEVNILISPKASPNLSVQQQQQQQMAEKRGGGGPHKMFLHHDAHEPEHGEPEEENVELMSGEIGDRDRNIEHDERVPSPSPMDDDMDELALEAEFHSMESGDDDDDDEDEDYGGFSLSMSLPAVSTSMKKKHRYDVSREFDFEFVHGNLEQKTIDVDAMDVGAICKPRRPLAPDVRPSSRARGQNLTNTSLLQALRMGEMDVQINICDTSELIDLLSIVCRAMVLLPYGLGQLREKLLFSLQTRMCDSYMLSQHFTFFLNSYRDCFAVSKLFKDHVCMQSVTELERLTGASISTMANASQTQATQQQVEARDADDEKISGAMSDRELTLRRLVSSPHISENIENAIEYSGSNYVEFFRLPLCYAQPDQAFVASQCTEFACPITGQSNVHRLEIRSIFQSKSRPLLVDCFLRNNYVPTSSFILKYGDDLRRDAAVLMMFRFMNSLWSGCRYHNKTVLATTYKCYPIGPDYGIIELIPNCQTLKDITDRYSKRDERLDDEVLDNIVATSAGSFMAAYVMGIRDRHYDNILVNPQTGCCFHIDFGYMLGEKVTGLDASKIAITADLVKVMGAKWLEFVDLCVQCWLVLRENYQELLEFSKLALSFLYSQETIQEFLNETLLLHLTVSDGRDKIRKRILQSPKKIKTKMKNWVHSVAQAKSPVMGGTAHKKKSSDIAKSLFNSWRGQKRKSVQE